MFLHPEWMSVTLTCIVTFFLALNAWRPHGILGCVLLDAGIQIGMLLLTLAPYTDCFRWHTAHCTVSTVLQTAQWHAPHSPVKLSSPFLYPCFDIVLKCYQCSPCCPCMSLIVFISHCFSLIPLPLAPSSQEVIPMLTFEVNTSPAIKRLQY